MRRILYILTALILALGVAEALDVRTTGVLSSLDIPVGPGGVRLNVGGTEDTVGLGACFGNLCSGNSATTGTTACIAHRDLGFATTECALTTTAAGLTKLSAPVGQPASIAIAGSDKLYVETNAIGLFDGNPDAKVEIVPSGTLYGNFILAISSQNDTTGAWVAVMGTGDVGFNDASPDARVDITASAGQTYVLDVASSNATSLFRVAHSGAIGLGGTLGLWVRTKEQIDAITPAVGDVVACSDCTVPYDICIGTAATPSGFRAVINSAINTAIPGTLVNKGCGVGQ